MVKIQGPGSRSITTYKRILLKYLFTLGGKLDWHDRDLPPIIAASDLGSGRSSENLMTEAYANHANPVLLEQLLCEIDKFQDPWVVVEGVVF